MNKFTYWVSRSWRDLARIITIIGIGVLVMLFYNQQVDNQQKIESTRKIAENTQRISEDTQTIIKELRQSFADQKLDSQQKLDIIICMLLVLPGNRTTNTAEGCQQQVEARTPSRSQNNPQNNPRSTAPQPNTGNPQPPDEPEEPDDPSVVESIIGTVMETTQGVRDFLNPFN